MTAPGQIMTKLRLTDFDLRLSYTATAVIRRYIAPTQPCHFGPWSRFGHMPAERPASRTRCPLRVKSRHCRDVRFVPLADIGERLRMPLRMELPEGFDC